MDTDEIKKLKKLKKPLDKLPNKCYNKSMKRELNLENFILILLLIGYVKNL